LARPQHGRGLGDEPWHIGALRASNGSASSSASTADRVGMPSRELGLALKAPLAGQADRVEAQQHQ
jgi:hypothetical protein